MSSLSHSHNWVLFRLQSLGYVGGWLAVLVVGLGFRLFGLGHRPMHPDEANQAWKTGLLWQTGIYRYDPAEHHGPTLYYLTQPVLWVAGPAEFAETTEVHYRLLPALAGMAVLPTLLAFRKALGNGPVLLAAWLTALSPMMVFYSRYYIQEILLVLFTLGVLGSFCCWRQSKGFWSSVGWSAMTGGCLGLMAATKETWILAFTAIVVAAFLEQLYSGGWRARQRPFLPQQGPQPSLPCPAWTKWALLGGIGFLTAVGMAGIFYTGFGTYPEGFRDAFKAYEVYLLRGMEAGMHRHPLLFYLHRLLAYRAKGVFWSEGFIFILAVLGGLKAFCPRKSGPAGAKPQSFLPSETSSISTPCSESSSAHLGPLADQGWENLSAAVAQLPSARERPTDQVFLRFLVFYTLVVTAGYSLIPYKTPWCALTFWQGWILLAGVGGSWLMNAWRRMSGWFASGLGVAGAAIVLLGGSGHLAWQSWQLNFNPRLFADGDRNPWVYAHTSMHIFKLADRMEQLAAVAPLGHRISIHVIVPDNYWPLPWYLRGFEQDRIGYWEQVESWAEVAKGLPPPDVLIVQTDVADLLAPYLQAPYNQQMLFRLRPEVFVRIYVRQELWEAFLKWISTRPSVEQ